MIDAGAGEAARGIEQIDRRGHAAEPLLDGREAADRLVELLADARIGAGRVRGEGGARRRQRRQRDAAPGRERAHQHLPALAHPRDAADDVVDRNEDVVAAGRPVLERLQRRQMPAADLDAGQIGRHQRDRDADVLALADQVIGIVELEREPDQGRDRRQRDVALVPVEPDADDLAALPGAAADHAGVGHRCRVRARLRAGEPEAGDLARIGEPRQPVILLRLGAELEQELTGPERIRHHGGDGARGRARRQLADDLRMPECRKAEPAILLRNDHGEELVALEKVPHLGRQVAQLEGDLPIIEHVAELVDWTVKERLLLGRQPRRRDREQLRPVGIAGEQVGVPPHVAGLDRLALGVGERGQHVARPAEDRLGDPVPAK